MRMKSVDLVKGVAIVTVVFIHLLNLQAPAENFGISPGEPNVLSLMTVLGMFYTALSLFYLFSGYFYRPDRSAWQNIKKRLVQLVGWGFGLFIVLTIVMFCYLSMTGKYNLTIDDFNNYFWIMLAGNPFQPTIPEPCFAIHMGFYFVATLFVASVIFYLIADWVLADTKRTVVSILVCLVLMVVVIEAMKFFFPSWPHDTRECFPYHTQTFPFALAMMITGGFLAKHNVIEKLEASWKTWKFWILMIVTGAIALLLSTLFPTFGMYETEFGPYGSWNVFTYYAMAIFAGCMMIQLATVASKIPILFHIFEYYSKSSLFVLLMHIFYAKLLISFFEILPNGAWFPNMGMGTIIPVWIGTIILCGVSAFVIYKVKSRLFNRKGSDIPSSAVQSLIETL